MQKHRRDPAKELFWRRMLRRFQTSGLDGRGFCRRHGLSEPSFYGWRRELQKRDRETKPSGQAKMPPKRSKPAPLFVPVRVLAKRPAAADRIEIVLASGQVIRVPAGFDRGTLAEVIKLLERPAC